MGLLKVGGEFVRLHRVSSTTTQKGGLQAERSTCDQARLPNMVGWCVVLNHRYMTSIKMKLDLQPTGPGTLYASVRGFQSPWSTSHLPKGLRSNRVNISIQRSFLRCLRRSDTSHCELQNHIQEPYSSANSCTELLHLGVHLTSGQQHPATAIL